MIYRLNEESATLLKEAIKKISDAFYQDKKIHSVFMNAFLCENLEGMDENVRKGVNIVFYVILDSIENFSMESYNAYLESISFNTSFHFYGNMVEESLFFERKTLSRMDYLLSDGEILFDKTGKITHKYKTLESLSSPFLNHIYFLR